ncbi:MAG: hypothetical protein KIT84_04310 [Labilithrix sp.]|nr:hypothetical protein [Labilithrix sp.]MCW5810209.1 hypothetical protein [Labilithrix sp.]
MTCLLFAVVDEDEASDRELRGAAVHGSSLRSRGGTLAQHRDRWLELLRPLLARGGAYR